MALVFQQAIPDIRANLFPSLVKKAKAPVEHKQATHWESSRTCRFFFFK